MAERKEYRDMNREERLQDFDATVEEEKRRHGGNVSALRAALVIGVRHYTHPFAYELGKEFMIRAAAACGDALEPDGTWGPCRGELWLEDVLAATPPPRITKAPPENQDWQQPCSKCGKVKCPKPGEVARWMREATPKTFERAESMASEKPGVQGWRDQATYYSTIMEQQLVSWSRCLEGVCFDCQAEAFPDEEERLGNPEGIRAAHWHRWCFLVPLIQEQRARDEIRATVLADFEATGKHGKALAAQLRPPTTWNIVTKDGALAAPCAWARGGLVVVMLGEADLAKARKQRAEGVEGAYPTQCWSVTHSHSGTSVVSSFNMADDAIAVARRLLPLVNWDRPMEEVLVDIHSSPEAQRQIRLEQAVANAW
jgi:hypothetical protein